MYRSLPKIFFIILLLGELCTAGRLKAETYDLAAAISRGLAANLGVVAQEIAVQEAEIEKIKAYGNFLPTLTIAAQKNRLTNDEPLENNTDYLNQRNTNGNVHLSQPIFSGFRGIASVKRANRGLDYQQAQAKDAKLKLIYQITEQFIQYLKVHDDIIRVEKSVERLTKQLAAARAFYEQRMAPMLHVLQAEVALEKAKQDLNQVKNQAETSRLVLNHALAIQLDSPVEYTGALESMDYGPGKSLAEYLQASKERQDIKMLSANIEIARQDAKSIIERNLPTASLDVYYNKDRTDYENPGYSDIDRQYWSAGVNVSMPFFQGGRNMAAYMQQNLVVRRYEENLKGLLSQIELEVKSNYFLMQDAYQRISSATNIKEAADRNYQRAESRFKTGLGNIQDVLTTQEDVSQAEANIVAARADFQTIKAKLDYLAGQTSLVATNTEVQSSR